MMIAGPFQARTLRCLWMLAAAWMGASFNAHVWCGDEASPNVCARSDLSMKAAQMYVHILRVAKISLNVCTRSGGQATPRGSRTEGNGKAVDN